MEANMNEVLEKISRIGIVPVVVLDDAKDAIRQYGDVEWFCS